VARQDFNMRPSPPALLCRKGLTQSLRLTTPFYTKFTSPDYSSLMSASTALNFSYILVRKQQQQQ
jgi:hypothetical protein